MGIEPADQPAEPEHAEPEHVELAPTARRAAIVIVVAVLLVVAMVVVSVVATVRLDSADLPPGRRPGGGAVGPTASDHWHAALGVNDCGQWVPNWGWPPGTLAGGGLARAGSNGTLYAGLHSHGDAIIHMEPLTSDEMGSHATLGLYFRYGGWQVGPDAVTFVDVDERNGDLCDGKPGVLRWAVNGKEMHGDPSEYKLFDGDVVELVFTTAEATLPAQNAVPSYRALQDIIGPGLSA